MYEYVRSLYSRIAVQVRRSGVRDMGWDGVRNGGAEYYFIVNHCCNRWPSSPLTASICERLAIVAAFVIVIVVRVQPALAQPVGQAVRVFVEQVVAPAQLGRGRRRRRATDLLRFNRRHLQVGHAGKPVRECPAQRQRARLSKLTVRRQRSS